MLENPGFVQIQELVTLEQNPFAEQTPVGGNAWHIFDFKESKERRDVSMLRILYLLF